MKTFLKNILFFVCAATIGIAAQGEAKNKEHKEKKKQEKSERRETRHKEKADKKERRKNKEHPVVIVPPVENTEGAVTEQPTP